MYGLLSGQLIQSGPPTLLMVGGVGYELALPERARLRLPEIGEQVKLFTHLVVREDELSLYGFPSAQERDIFRALIAVNGVGPKVALAILGDAESHHILAAAAAGDPAPLTAVKGIGRKTAERLVVELRDRALPIAAAAPARAAAAAAGTPLGDDVTLALIGLGLSPDRAREVLAKLPEEDREGRPVQDVIRAALRHVSH